MRSRLRRLTAALVISLTLTGTVQPVSALFASEIQPETPEKPETTEEKPETPEKPEEAPETKEDASGEKTETNGEDPEEIPRETRRIKTVDDLKELSAKSMDESYTRGVRYVLENDLDLKDTDFRPISIFAGIFDGQGHVITGFSLNGSQDRSGFIRTVARDGYIKDLMLSGILEPGGDMTEIGGAAGINYGTLEDISFDGRILASEMVGGIAGHNMEGGVIRKCVNHAYINATRKTGGICGYNEGTIETCINRGKINANEKTAHEMTEEREADEDKEGDLDKFIPDTLDLKDENLFERFDKGIEINYTGGIAGACSGLIKDSVNYATVGYPHVGYMTGGITGYDRGIISGCKNRGRVYARKNGGGIAGQFEPYAVNAYSEDALNKTGESLEELTDRIESFHKDFGAEDDLTQSHIDTVRATSDELRDLIKYYKEYYRCKDDSVEREIKSKIDNIRDIADSINLRKYDKETKEALQVFIDNSDNISKLVEAWSESRSAGITADMMKFLPKLKEIGLANNGAVDTLMRKAVRLNKDADDIEDDLEELRSASMDLDDYLRGCEDDYKKDFRITSDDIQLRTDRLAAEMDVLSDGLKGSDAKLRADVDSMVSSLNSLNDSMTDSYKEIQTELQKVYDTDGIEDIFDDISDDDSTDLKKGVLLYSENEGDIESNINGGGIVGIITDDSGIRSDFEVVSEGQVSLNYDRYEKATILYCKNTGDITVRNDCAGGIAGRTDLGAVIASDNYGRVEAKDGSYAGGIVGKSRSLIRDCRSKCEAVSEKYAGGIAGIARSMINNVCLSAVDPEKEYHGAVAGDTDNADLDEKDRGTVSGNVFVYRGLGAINGVTDEREAQSVTYGELLKMDGIPVDFGKMTVVFKSDGKTVARMKVPYGGNVDSSNYPKIEESPEGKFGYWDDTDLSNVQQNITVETIYVDYITSVASDETGKPGMIVSGRFFDGTTLKYNEERADMQIPGGSRIYRTVSFSVENEYGIPDNPSYTVRYRADSVFPGDEILVKENDAYVVKESRRDGDYIVFSREGEGVFYLAHTRRESIGFAARVAAGVAILIVILVLIISSIMKKKKALKEDSDNDRE